MASILSYLFRAAPRALANYQQDRGALEERERERQRVLEERKRQEDATMQRLVLQQALQERELTERQRQFDTSQQTRTSEYTQDRQQRAAELAEQRKYRESLDTYNRGRQTEQDRRAEEAARRADQAATRAERGSDIAERRLTLAEQQAARSGQAKPLSEAKGSELAVTQGLLKMGTALRDELGGFVAKGENVTGPIRGRIAPLLQGLRMQSGEHTNVQGRLANLSSEVMKARSGGAITPQEFERLEPFLPSRNADEVANQDKLAGFVQALATIQQEKLEALEDIGRDVGQLKGRYDPEIGNLLERSRAPSVRGRATGTPPQAMPNPSQVKKRRHPDDVLRGIP